MASPPPYAIVVLSPEDPAVRDGALRIKQKLARRGHVITPVALNSPALANMLGALDGGTLYLIGHGDELSIGDRQPANLAVILEENDLPATVARIQVLTCRSGVQSPYRDEAPALALKRDLMSLYRLDTFGRVTGLTGTAVDYGGSFRVIPSGPVIDWMNQVRANVGNATQLAHLVDQADALDPQNAGNDLFDAFLNHHPHLKAEEEEKEQIYGAIQLLINQLHDKNQQINYRLPLYMLVQQIGDALEEEEDADEQFDLAESVLTALDTLEPFISKGLALNRQGSKVHF